MLEWRHEKDEALGVRFEVLIKYMTVAIYKKNRWWDWWFWGEIPTFKILKYHYEFRILLIYII